MSGMGFFQHTMQAFVGKMGGIRQLFEQRRLRISTSFGPRMLKDV